MDSQKLFPLLFLEEISAMPASAFASSGMEILAPAINPGRPVKKSGSPQEFVRSGILRGFPDLLKSDVFGVGYGHAPCFQ